MADKNNGNSAAVIAANLAAATAAKAVELASTATATATALATKTAESTAGISKDIEWMKKSLIGIEGTLKEMSGVFVTTSIFTLNQNMTDDHEKRIRAIESNIGRWLGAIAVITFLITIGVSILLKKFI